MAVQKSEGCPSVLGLPVVVAAVHALHQRVVDVLEVDAVATGARDGEAGFQFQGVNKIQGDTWIYTYQGAVFKTLKAASNKRFVITEAVMRSLARVHVPGEAGGHATFIAVKRDQYPD